MKNYTLQIILTIYTLSKLCICIPHKFYMTFYNLFFRVVFIIFSNDTDTYFLSTNKTFSYTFDKWCTFVSNYYFKLLRVEIFEISLLFSRQTDNVHKNLISPIIASVSAAMCVGFALIYRTTRRCFGQLLVSGALHRHRVSQFPFNRNFSDQH